MVCRNNFRYALCLRNIVYVRFREKGVTLKKLSLWPFVGFLMFLFIVVTTTNGQGRYLFGPAEERELKSALASVGLDNARIVLNLEIPIPARKDAEATTLMGTLVTPSTPKIGSSQQLLLRAPTEGNWCSFCLEFRWQPMSITCLP